MEVSEKLTWIELDKKHFFHPSSSIKDSYEKGPVVFMERGEGIYIYDADGKEYVDGLSSLWNVNVGHGRKELAESASEQMKKLAYTHSFSRFSHKPAVQLAEKIASLAPGDLSVVHFTSGGSESNDSAFKIARHYFKLKGQSQRFKIIARDRAYHGVSMGATSATGLSIFRELGGPLAAGFIHASAPYSYRCEECKPECKGDCAIESIYDLIEQEGAETIAAIIIEPVQGAGGVIIPPPDYIKAVRKICDKFGILMIADEVITGFGRTGKWFGIEHEGVVPDMITFAKGVTSGYIPLGGVVISERIYRELVEHSNQNFAHGFTYSGHPAACAVALKNIEIITNEKLVENAAGMGILLQQGLEKIKNELDIVGNVMSRGLLGHIEIVKDKTSKEAFSSSHKVASQITEQAFEYGLITRPIMYNNTDIIAICPPLIINEQQINQLLDILQESIKKIMGRI
ncbi:putrescine aminotransferase [Paenibacillus forsythiae]|uniref:Putrescine aminotransferase n=1 Tax=Paenibacillus forsythiae TaxID=365616 RepID=A0ABU3H2B7_9BACL|nr:aspartate aminotransferase family protein [Paenibacillus forsythiae]MDT3424964.1 putrescine aminotransferase [Paenibacillus forsythiae]